MKKHSDPLGMVIFVAVVLFVFAVGLWGSLSEGKRTHDPDGYDTYRGNR